MTAAAGADADDALAAAAAVLGDRARRNVALGPFTTYGVGGPAALLLEAADADALALARRAVAASGVPVLVVGRGSNLLVADSGFRGLAITLGDFFADIHPGDGLVGAGAAVSLPVLARRTAGLGLRGLEWAVGVPGSVGGAVRMNAGGHGSDVAASLTRAWVFDLGGAPDEGGREVTAGDLALGYRRSALGPLEVVVAAEFAVTAGDRSEAEAEIASVVRWRREHQPGGSNAGSVFANPEGDSAGRLIDAAGLRGHRRGSAFVSPKHANFVQVDSGGSADDVRALIEEVRTAVQVRQGVLLRLENHLVGFSDQTLQ
ncbi:MAG TPA: UDP-N-acetylmuramate dehydrogenase [Acidimicrobiales bacterium]|nr:UDP-N-acetylmuramate dehydrogenase [Acidimicrobiales bacterium]